MITGAIILGAGKGTRMNSEKSKILHCIFEKTLIEHVLESVEKLIDTKPILVVGEKNLSIKKCLKKRVEYAIQKNPLGTGDALKIGLNFLKNEDFIFVLCGDIPLITKKTLELMKKQHVLEKRNVTILSSVINNSKDYGRICRNKSNEFLKIVEEKEATFKEKEIKEINSGIYIFSRKIIEKYFKNKNNFKKNKKEIYLTDIFKIINENEGKIGIFKIKNYEEIKGINNRINLAEVNKLLQKKINNKWMLKGVTFINYETAYISSNVVIGKDVIIGTNVHLKGKTIIKNNVEIGNNTTIKDSIIESETKITESIVLESKIGKECIIGPFSYIRPNCIIKNNVKIGDFVELKNTTVDDNSKIPHHSYMGDCIISKNVNIGAGTITCNYDGKNKHKTNIEENVFIGSNSNLVAPITVGQKAYIAAGSTITENVPSKSLAIARGMQKNIKKWKKNK